MKHYDARTFLFSSGTLILLFVLVLMTSCAPTTAKKKDSVNPIADAKHISKVLSCMFGGCKTEEQIKKEQDQITKEFDRVDAQEKADRDKTQPASK